MVVIIDPPADKVVLPIRVIILHQGDRVIVVVIILLRVIMMMMQEDEEKGCYLHLILFLVTTPLILHFTR
jgi:hypothetical protein